MVQRLWVVISSDIYERPSSLLYVKIKQFKLCLAVCSRLKASSLDILKIDVGNKEFNCACRRRIRVVRVAKESELIRLMKLSEVEAISCFHGLLMLRITLCSIVAVGVDIERPNFCFTSL